MDMAKAFNVGAEARRKCSTCCSSRSTKVDRRCHGTGDPPHLWSVPSGWSAGPAVAGGTGPGLASPVPSDAALSGPASRPPGDQSRGAAARVGRAGLTAGRGVRIARGKCVEHYGEGEPYLPLLEALGQLSRGPDPREVL